MRRGQANGGASSEEEGLAPLSEIAAGVGRDKVFAHAYLIKPLRRGIWCVGMWSGFL